MDLVFKGKIINALPHKSGVSKSTGNSWEIAEYVIEETDGQYPKKMVFSISGPDRIKNINLQVGEIVEVHFDIDAREYNGRWYNSISAFRIDRVGQNAAQQPQQQQAAPQQNAAGGSDNLPF
jgi:hypothetical protein